LAVVVVNSEPDMIDKKPVQRRSQINDFGEF
jgi:hypothetical protein